MTGLSGPVIETVVTTLDERGQPHFAAMGVVWDEPTIAIRPYANTRTLRHLRERGEAVVNVTDDVLLFAKSALTHKPPRGRARRPRPRRGPARRLPLARGPGPRDRRPSRAIAATRQRHHARGRRRDQAAVRPVSAGPSHAVRGGEHPGFRLRWLPFDEILGGIARLEPLVEKTGGPGERAAFSVRPVVCGAGASPRSGLRNERGARPPGRRRGAGQTAPRVHRFARRVRASVRFDRCGGEAPALRGRGLPRIPGAPSTTVTRRMLRRVYSGRSSRRSERMCEWPARSPSG